MEYDREYHNKLGNVTISDYSINTLLTWFALPPQSQVSIEQLLMVIYVTQNALYHQDECICGKQKSFIPVEQHWNQARSSQTAACSYSVNNETLKEACSYFYWQLLEIFWKYYFYINLSLCSIIPNQYCQVIIMRARWSWFLMDSLLGQ